MQEHNPYSDYTLNYSATQIKSTSFCPHHIWNEYDISNFSKRTLAKENLCGKTTSLINTYIGNPDDPSVQYIGEHLLTKYSYADDYLVKLQASISTAIETSRSIINEERKKIQRTSDIRERNYQSNHNDYITQRERNMLKLINQMPEDVVHLIKDYLPKKIILSAISIPNYEIYKHLSPIKLKNIKGVYDVIRRFSSNNIPKLYQLVSNDVIREQDIHILSTIQPKPSKDQIISRIRDICYCYNLVLNIVSKIPSKPYYSDTSELCKKMTMVLTKNLTYIYKLMNFAARPQFNGRAKPTSNSNTKTRTKPKTNTPHIIEDSSA
jgi:hypothetical protein